MMKVSKVSLIDIKPTLLALLGLHHSEVEATGRSMNPDFDRYQMLEDSGSYILHGLYDGDVLVGYSGDFIVDSLHYKGERDGVNDLVYITKDYRGFGFGYMLRSAVCTYMTSVGVSTYTANLKSNNPCERSMRAGGFHNTEVVWHINLEEQAWHQ